MSEPFRLDDAAVPGTPFRFTFRGVPYLLPPLAAWPVTVLSSVAAGQVSDALTLLLGEDAAARLVDDGLTIGHLSALLDQAGKTRDEQQHEQ